MKKILAGFAAAGTAIFIGCFGTETENPEMGLGGKLVNTEGVPVIGARVMAHASSGAVADSTRTDASGRFVFHDLEPGTYNLIGDYLRSTLAVLIPDVTHAGRDSSRDLGTDTLRVPGGIRGRVFYRGMPQAGLDCYLSRTAFAAQSDSAGFVLFTGIPQGKYELVYYAQNLGLPYNHRDSVEVVSGGVTELAPKILDSIPLFSATPM